MKYLSLAKLTLLIPSQGGDRYLLGNIETKSDIHLFRSGYKLSHTRFRDASLKIADVGLDPKSSSYLSFRSDGTSAAANCSVSPRMFK